MPLEVRSQGAWRTGADDAASDPLGKALPHRRRDNQALFSDRSVLSFLHIGLDIFIEKQTLSRELVCHNSDPIYVIGMARVALFKRGPRVGIGHTFRLGPGKIDLLTETIATVVSTHRHGAQIPTCIGCERNRNLWKADPAYIVAV
jgi:hypothetical protein